MQFSVSVPPSVSPPGLLASATVTLPVKVEAKVAGIVFGLDGQAEDVPAATLAGGCCVITNFVARHGVHGDGVGGCAREAAAGDLQRVAGPDRVERQSGEVGHALAGVYRERAAQASPRRGYSPAPRSLRRCRLSPRCRTDPRSWLAGRSLCSRSR